jgi:hypothetical protein
MSLVDSFGTLAGDFTQDTDVDDFFFHRIKVDNDPHETFKHDDRPDDTFKLSFKDSQGSEENMVLFYEGDNHGKDEGKLSNTDGDCFINILHNHKRIMHFFCNG